MKGGRWSLSVPGAAITVWLGVWGLGGHVSGCVSDTWGGVQSQLCHYSCLTLNKLCILHNSQLSVKWAPSS